jgi:hypothetical protein
MLHSVPLRLRFARGLRTQKGALTPGDFGQLCEPLPLAAGEGFPFAQHAPHTPHTPHMPAQHSDELRIEDRSTSQSSFV